MICGHKGRGRPSKKDKLSEKEMLKDRINKLIDASIEEWKYENLKGMEEPRNRSRCLEPDDHHKEEDDFKKKLEELLTQYRDLEEKRPLPESVSICREVEEMIEDEIQFDGEEEEIESPSKNCRTTYLKFKDPIEKFPQTAFDLLPEEKKSMLLQNSNEIFSDQITYQSQVEKVITLIYDPKRGSNSGATAIGRLFGVSRGTIYEHYKRMKKERRQIVGRPGTLNEEQIQAIYMYVVECYQKHSSPNIGHLIDFVFNNFNISISSRTLKDSLHRTSRFKRVIGQPIESVRADVELQIILDYYERLDSFLQCEIIPPQFFFNLDESGFQEFCDARNQTVFVPIEAQEERVFYSTDRTTKRSTLIGCIAADGTALKPCVVTPNKSVEKALQLQGYNETNCLIVSQEKGFINAELFAFWADHVLFPEITKRRKEYGYSGTVVVTLDGCSSHVSDYFLDECSYHGVYPWQEPPGTSDQIQALDLGIFGIQKKLKTKVSKNADLSKTSIEIAAIVDSWRKATTPSNIVSAFQQAGIFIESNDQFTRMRADPNKARAIRGMEHVPSNHIITGRKLSKIPEF